MGLWNNDLLCLEEIKELTKSTLFSCAEIKDLSERFKYLDRSKAGNLTFADFHLIPEFYSNQFSHLIMKFLEKKFLYEKITFRRFVEFLSIFNNKAAQEKRINFLFNIFDIKEEGKLTRETLEEIYFLMTKKNNVDEDDIAYIFKNYDVEEKGFLDFNDFTLFYLDDPSLEKKLIINFKDEVVKTKSERIWNIFWPFKSSK